MTEYVIGIDAGASKTRAMALDRAGRVISGGEAPGGNLMASATAMTHIRAALARVVDAAEPPAGVALCAAGSENRETRERARAELAKAVPRAKIVVGHDALGALYAASPNGVGVVLLSGTGSIAYGRDANGREARAGGWGYLFGDEGSAAWLGMAALRAAAKDADGRGPATRLLTRILEELRVSDLRDALPHAYGAPHPSPAVIAAARVVARVAEHEKDDEARRIVAEAADELARAAVAVAQRLDLDEIHLGGGAFSAFPALEHATRARLLALMPAARVATLNEEPARGAARLAAVAAWGEAV